MRTVRKREVKKKNRFSFFHNYSYDDNDNDDDIHWLSLVTKPPSFSISLQAQPLMLCIRILQVQQRSSSIIARNKSSYRKMALPLQFFVGLLSDGQEILDMMMRSSTKYDHQGGHQLTTENVKIWTADMLAPDDTTTTIMPARTHRGCTYCARHRRKQLLRSGAIKQQQM